MPGQDARAASKVVPEAEALRGIWLTRGKDGRLTAYVPGEGGLRRWTESRPGGPGWGAPDVVPVPHLTHLSVTQSPEAYVHLVGRREQTAADGGVAVDIVHAIQYQTGRPPSAWHSLGNPHKEAHLGVGVGAPVAAVSRPGEVHVVVRDGEGTMRLRREMPGGKWGIWGVLHGKDVEGEPAVVPLGSGCVSVLATTGEGVLHWPQEKPGGRWGAFQRLGVTLRPGSLAVLETAPGRATYYGTDPAGGVVAYRADAGPMPLGGAPGDGPQAVIRTVLDGFDCTVLAHRGVNGCAIVGVGVTENEADGLWWSDTGVPCLTTPVLTHDAEGRVVMAVVGTDGAPRVARQTDGPGLSFEQWREL
ncbi:hypothetical protein ABT025_08725 [Streptomyces sp. NPDC002809]|uniref:hypothetical protein n=1 Tax=Streptomyces sp. NPDC002809 TaxID=3154433 RepID=UPI00331D97B7